MRNVLVDAASVGLELDDTRRLAVAAALVIRVDGNSGLVLGAWPEIMQQKKIVDSTCRWWKSGGFFFYLSPVMVMDGKSEEWEVLTSGDCSTVCQRRPSARLYMAKYPWL